MEPLSGLKLRVMTVAINGTFVVDSDVELHGVINGGVTVLPGNKLKLCGTVSDFLTVMPGAQVEVHGWVAGQVHNRGGEITIFGSVDSVVNDGRGAVTRMSHGGTLGEAFVERRRRARS